MNRRDQIHSLGTLVQLRSTEVDKLQTELARQEATRARYAANLERLHALAEGSGASGKLAPALALNCGQYKQAVFALADTHRTDLQLHEANMAVSQRNLAQAWTRRELLGKVLEQQQDALAREQDRAARKREDEIATQSWLAGRA
ncbi:MULTISPECIES: flagellar FliJ family protein [unclassified Massilia]|uniref:flagellar FliJ family protein n=1 Tax=unclassified Massilia TaxID=2609279 RepID=UPI00177C132A|nr:MULTISPECIES: flagellar FliJ family protein [unclassified Massilia]MBD8528982.1 flagellar FliJ family protein [Massilia sp. CFBP 13647]MBD8672376.1 flagellar FliJ family protein [Massilia sp. CFBP 13721]